MMSVWKQIIVSSIPAMEYRRDNTAELITSVHENTNEYDTWTELCAEYTLLSAHETETNYLRDLKRNRLLDRQKGF